MKKIKVEITGITPLLMNSPKSMIENKVNQGARTITKSYDLKAEAEKLAYKTDKGELYVPSEAVKGSLLGASAYKKFGKFSAKPIIAGGVFILTPEILLGTKEYTLDTRTVVIQRARVVKSRPKIEKWKLNFELLYNEDLISSADDIKSILIDAGQRIGILDFRPAKMGSFGMFEVTKWEEIK